MAQITEAMNLASRFDNLDTRQALFLVGQHGTGTGAATAAAKKTLTASA